MKKIIGILLVMISAGCLFSANQVIAQEIVVIVNASNSKNDLNKTELRDIYMGKTSFWEGNIKIFPINQADEKVVGRFVNAIVGLPNEVYKNYWVKKLFQEGLMPPVQKSSAKDILEAVGSNGGAIGYIFREDYKEKSGAKIVYVVPK